MPKIHLHSGHFLVWMHDGFITGAGGNWNVNASGNTYVSWNWKGGGTAVSNTDGSITSSVSANTTAGFSIVSYTGTGAVATIGHGLGVVPAMIIVKVRSSAGDWSVYHTTLGNTKNLKLNTTAQNKHQLIIGIIHLLMLINLQYIMNQMLMALVKLT
jgi:hypothetical protein